MYVSARREVRCYYCHFCGASPYLGISRGARRLANLMHLRDAPMRTNAPLTPLYFAYTNRTRINAPHPRPQKSSIPSRSGLELRDAFRLRYKGVCFTITSQLGNTSELIERSELPWVENIHTITSAPHQDRVAAEVELNRWLEKKILEISGYDVRFTLFSVFVLEESAKIDPREIVRDCVISAVCTEDSSLSAGIVFSRALEWNARGSARAEFTCCITGSQRANAWG
ncbi:hypothetical protein DFH09DRAFT_1277177 [Mycena vulgaris]|nr:hypothetical protein DFH09DRAFT_1277177 [Mycena vulgaris]